MYNFEEFARKRNRSNFLGLCHTQTTNVWSIIYPHLGSLEWVNKCKYSIQLVKLHPPQLVQPSSGNLLGQIAVDSRFRLWTFSKMHLSPEFMECVWGPNLWEAMILFVSTTMFPFGAAGVNSAIP